jgi:hypothetical protein
MLYWRRGFWGSFNSWLPFEFLHLRDDLVMNALFGIEDTFAPVRSLGAKARCRPKSLARKADDTSSRD